MLLISATMPLEATLIYHYSMTVPPASDGHSWYQIVPLMVSDCATNGLRLRGFDNCFIRDGRLGCNVAWLIVFYILFYVCYYAG